MLERTVRATFAANEYPSTMQRLYQWSPDECIPEFYSDPQIFISTHAEMAAMQPPLWATDAEDFVARHRQAPFLHTTWRTALV